MAEDLIRRRKRRGYTLIDNEPINNKSLRFEDIGLLTYVLSKPDDWVIYKSEIISSHANGRESVNAIFNRLEQNGYLLKVERRKNNGQFSHNEYLFTDVPYQFDDDAMNPRQSGTLTVDGKPSTACRQRETVNGNPTPTNNIYTNTINTKLEEEEETRANLALEPKSQDNTLCLDESQPEELEFENKIQEFENFTAINMSGDARRQIYRKWHENWGFSSEVILKAAALMAELTKNPNLSYVDKILADWKKGNIRSLAEAIRAVEAFRSQRPIQQKSKSKTIKYDDYPIFVPP